MKASRTPLDENVQSQPNTGSLKRNPDSPVGSNVNESGGSAEKQSVGLADNAPAKSPNDMGIDGAPTTDATLGYGNGSSSAPDLGGI